MSDELGFQLLVDMHGSVPAAEPASVPESSVQQSNPRLDPRLRPVRGHYDTEHTNADNEKHWERVTSLSPNAHANPAARRIIRTRVRYESTNNPYLVGMNKDLRADTVGTCPRLQFMATVPFKEGETRGQRLKRRRALKQATREIELGFKHWGEEIRLGPKLRTYDTAYRNDGEAFGVLKNNRDLVHPVKLDWCPIESDQVHEPEPNFDDPKNLDGVIVNEADMPVRYRILREHPGSDLFHEFTQEVDTIDRRWVTHVWAAERPGQIRGVSQWQSAMTPASQTRRFTKATTLAAEHAASFSAIAIPSENDESADNSTLADEVFDLEHGTMLGLPAPGEFTQLQAQHPNATFESFKGEMTDEVGRAQGLPSHRSRGTARQYNYSSVKKDDQQIGVHARIDQYDLRITTLDKIALEWCREAVLQHRPDGSPYLSGAARNYLNQENLDLAILPPHQWHVDPKPPVDPARENKADTEALGNGSKILQDLIGAQSERDWEEQIELGAEALGIEVEQYQAALLRKIFGVAPAAPTEARQGDDGDDQTGDQAQAAAAAYGGRLEGVLDDFADRLDQFEEVLVQ